jgi:hypothetical protein
MPLGWLAGAAIAGVGVQAYNAYNASQIAGSQEGMAQTIFGEQQGFEAQLAQLIANPSSVTSLPGYQFQLAQGTQAVARSGAAGGFLGSGNMATALTQYGQGLASSFYGQQASLLAQLSGITSASSPSQAGSVATSASANTANQTNNMLSQLGILSGLNAGGSGISPAEQMWLANNPPGSGPPTMTIPGYPGYTFNTPGVN